MDPMAIRRMRVRQLTWEADGVISIALRDPLDAGLPEWTVGAHVDLVLDGELIRPYSLCGDPADRHEWRVAVLREPASTGGSAYIHEFLRPGQLLDVIGPKNNFPLLESTDYLLIAGGIGITPLIPMVYQLDAQGATWRLVYGGRRRPSMAFLACLTSFGERVDVVAEDERGWPDLPAILSNATETTAVYCCGPEGLIQAVEAECLAQNLQQPHIECFTALGRRPGRALEDMVENKPFQLVLDRSGKRFEVPPSQTIIDVLKAARVFVPTSCTEGYCGVCETGVVSGIPDHRDSYLSDTDKATNLTMMVCCGWSKTDVLVLDL
jgi:ferredoxin-NADP reductase